MRRLTIVLAIILAPITASAADVYLVQGLARGVRLDSLGTPEEVVWASDAIFYNRGANDATVKLLGISNGQLPPGAPTEITVPAGHSTSIAAAGMSSQWQPLSGDPLWVLHLNVPNDVTVANALFVRAQTQIGPNPTFNPLLFKYGKISLPVFLAPVAPNQPQIALMTSLGDPGLIPSHTNVAIYNEGSAVATARIEIRRHCDDALVQASNVSIAPNTIQQIYNLPGSGPCQGATAEQPPASVYTIITVDQPSLTMVSSIASTYGPLTSMSITAPQ